ncbi:MAG: diphosphate--fructose-6-phosphate 1-phosphotransferase [Firmicutes bacterium]|nr:diphosphate--fructose-6-phosphate 1-phosphotransferase [Bacillota bacterium]
MANCIAAQSGGPTAVINATLAGILEANTKEKVYDKVYGGLHGIEGILQERIVHLMHDSEKNSILKQTPAAILGSCRYKLRREKEEDFVKIMDIMDKYDIQTFFYIGGNDSMDTVKMLAEYAEKHGINKRFIGCPKTIDNDLVATDHTPGYGSAAKFIASTVLATNHDYNVYTRREIFIVETMGRDTGWLAASAYLNKIPDILLLPEDVFNKQKFLSKVEQCLNRNNKCYIVTAEGLSDPDNNLAEPEAASDDGFNHAKLGGGMIANSIKRLITEEKLSANCKVQDLGLLQRCFSPSLSETDVEESMQVGKTALIKSKDPNFTGKMINIIRNEGKEYSSSFGSANVADVANKVKFFPKEWILDGYSGITEDAINYILPLIQGNIDMKHQNGMPVYMEPYHKMA